MVTTNFLGVKTSVRCILMKKPKDDWVIHTTECSGDDEEEEATSKLTGMRDGLLFLECVAS